jgi:ribulose-phosphate 3-epimerase
MDIQIIPSINVQSRDEFITNLRSVEGAVSTVQIDIADGIFTDWVNWNDPDSISMLETPLKFELHLMDKEPMQILEQWDNIKNISRVIFHSESHYPELTKFKTLDTDISIALNPNTEIESVEPFLSEIHSVTLLGVEPGSSGQTFNPIVLEKIRLLREKHPMINIEVDGGVNEKTIPEIVRAGANILCVGNAIFGQGDPKENITKIKELIRNSQ